MKTKLDELIEWMEKNRHMDAESVYYYAKQLRDIPPKEPPYDRETFRRELIVGLCGNPNLCTSFNNNAEWANKQADAIIAEYERRQGNEQR
jgi:hypothetical protein